MPCGLRSTVSVGSSAFFPTPSKLSGMRGVSVMRNVLLTLSLTILLASGCASSAASRPPMPAKPTLETLMPTPDGGICMGRDDARELLLYIDQLERR